MDWLTHMNRAMDYIESHLQDEADYDAIARIACCPQGLFPRIFAVLAGLPLSEYLRRRRLSQAALDLCATDDRVIDIALRYGYDSPDAFTAAFRRQHGASPTEARHGATLKAFPKLTFSLTLKGDVEMNYRIEQKPAFRAIGRSVVTTNAGQQNNLSIPAFWQQCDGDGVLARLRALGAASAVTGAHLLGLCYGAMNDGTFHYMIGVGAAGDAVPEGLEALDVPASTWAVFEAVGPLPQAIQALWQRVMGEFLTGGAYRHAGTPDFELYYPGANDENYRSEVWVPVVRQ